MKYTIETTENGCLETLEFSDGTKFTKESVRVDGGCQSKDKNFANQLEMKGFSEELVDCAYDLFDGFVSLEFLEMADLEG